MSIVEQVIELSIEINDECYYRELEESLKQYHEMIQAGRLKPRESQINNSYTPFAFKSNYS